MSNPMKRHWANPEWRAAQCERIRQGLNPNRKGRLYAAMVDGGTAIKIGFSIYPESRMCALRTEQQLDFDLIAETPSSPAAERELHRTLRSHAIRSMGKEYYPVHILFHPALPPGLRAHASAIPMWSA